MTPEQIRDYEYPGIYKNVDRTPETPMPEKNPEPVLVNLARARLLQAQAESIEIDNAHRRRAFERHTIDRHDCSCPGRDLGAHRLDCPMKNGRYTVPRPERLDGGAVWAWVAMGALVGLYLVWKHWPW